MDFQTPSYIAKYMVSLIPSRVITVLEPTPGIGNIVRELVNYLVTTPVQFWAVNGR